MAYHIHTTRAIILMSRAEGDGHKMLTLLTEDLGLLPAHAQSIRMQKSKLRYHLQDYSFARVSLVRGKALWRVTGAETLSRAHLKNPSARALVAEACALATMLTVPDDPHTNLFDDMRAFYEYLGRSERLAGDALLLTQLRMFSRAGFLPEHESLGDFVRSRGIFPEVLERFREYRAEGHGILDACRAMTV